MVPRIAREPWFCRALSQDSLIVAEVALLTQTEKDSGEPLGLSLDWIMVPPQLKATAVQINQTNTAGSNAFFQRFGANNERIIVNEKLSDTNDWYFGTNQSNAPFLEVGLPGWNQAAADLPRESAHGRHPVHRRSAAVQGEVRVRLARSSTSAAWART
jgi:hypothetical protein